jgi:hypothetical protein
MPISKWRFESVDPLRRAQPSVIALHTEFRGPVRYKDYSLLAMIGAELIMTHTHGNRKSALPRSIFTPPYPHVPPLPLKPTPPIDLLPILRIGTLVRPTRHESIPDPRLICFFINPNRIFRITRFNLREK